VTATSYTEDAEIRAKAIKGQTEVRANHHPEVFKDHPEPRE